MTATTPSPASFRSLEELAAYLNSQLIAHRRPGITDADAFDAFLLKLIEEVGELAGAHSRLAGTSRRAGSIAEVEAELADVYLSAAIYAVQAGVWFFPAFPVPPFDPPLPPAPLLAVMAVNTGKLCELHKRLPVPPDAPDYEGRAGQAAALVTAILSGARIYAASTGIDLDAAVAAKVTMILARGWREEDTTASC